MPVPFTRYRHELPILLAFLVIAIVEVLVTHLLLLQWSPPLAWLLTASTIFFLAHLALTMHGLMVHPTLIDNTGVTVMFGRHGKVFVPLSQICAGDDVALSPEERGPLVFRASIMAHPNIALRLNRPLTVGKRQVQTVTMRLDRSDEFRTDLHSRLAHLGS